MRNHVNVKFTVILYFKTMKNLLSVAQAQPFPNNMFNNGYYGWDFGFGLLGIILTILFWVLIIVAIVYLVRYLGGHLHEEGKNTRSPMDILKERYAKGEITKDDFERIKRDLS